MFFSDASEVRSHPVGGCRTVKVVVEIETFIQYRRYDFAFEIKLYNLIVCVEFSLTGYDSKLLYLLAVIAISISDEGKSL